MGGWKPGVRPLYVDSNDLQRCLMMSSLDRESRAATGRALLDLDRVWITRLPIRRLVNVVQQLALEPPGYLVRNRDHLQAERDYHTIRT